MCPPSEHYSLLWNLFLLSPWWFTKPTCISVFFPCTSAVISDKCSSHLDTKTKKNKMSICGFYSTHNIRFFELICITAFHCSNILIFVFVCHCLWMMPFCLNRSSAMQIPCCHSNLICQRPSLNPSFWLNIPCCSSFHIHTHLIGRLKAFDFCIIAVSLMYMWKEGMN